MHTTAHPAKTDAVIDYAKKMRDWPTLAKSGDTLKRGPAHSRAKASFQAQILSVKEVISSRISSPVNMKYNS